MTPDAVRALAARRLRDPGAIADAWAQRRPGGIPADGRLLIVAADHPARGALAVRGDAHAMADRWDLIDRLVEALARPGVDGILGSADILEDLLLLGHLDGKLVYGTMNRGGLQGATFELDDRFTAYTPGALAARRLDGGKMLTRICLDDPGTAATLEACAHAVDGLAERGLTALVEPFLTLRAAAHRVQNQLDPDAVIRSIAIAAGLGSTSAHTWLKIPVVAEMERVLAATTLPTLLLGGDPEGDSDQTYAAWQHALSCPPVVGLVVGRTLLHPPSGSVADAVDTAARLVHGGDLG